MAANQHLIRLPLEILTDISGFLTASHDLKNFSLVNKVCRSAVRPALFHSVRLQIQSIDDLEPAINKLQTTLGRYSAFHHVRRLILDHRGIPRTEVLSPPQFSITPTVSPLEDETDMEAHVGDFFGALMGIENPLLHRGNIQFNRSWWDVQRVFVRHIGAPEIARLLPLEQFLPLLPGLKDFVLKSSGLQWSESALATIPRPIANALPHGCTISLDNFRLRTLHRSSMGFGSMSPGDEDWHVVRLSNLRRVVVFPGYECITHVDVGWSGGLGPGSLSSHYCGIDRVIKSMVGGLTPQLKEVYVHDHQYHLLRSRSPTACIPDTWQGQRSLIKPGALEVLHLFGMASVTCSELRQWAAVTDFSLLKVLFLASDPEPRESYIRFYELVLPYGIGPGGLDLDAVEFLAGHRFPALGSLYLQVGHFYEGIDLQRYKTAVVNLLSGMPNLTTLWLADRRKNFHNTLYHDGLLSIARPTLKKLHLIGDEKQGFLLTRPLDLRRLANACPLLEELGFSMYRKHGDPVEAEMYISLGHFRNLRRAKILLRTSGMPLTNNHEYLTSVGGDDLDTVKRWLNNSTLDEKLARAIFGLIAKARATTASGVFFEQLDIGFGSTMWLHHRGFNEDLANVMVDLRQKWTVTTRGRDDGLVTAVVEDPESVTRRARIKKKLHKSRRKHTTEPINAALRELWPTTRIRWPWPWASHDLVLPEVEIRDGDVLST